MAVSFATTNSIATVAPQPQLHQAYRKSNQHLSVPATPTTLQSLSPTSTHSTRLALPRHQGIYRPRTAIGVPAALRKTEKPGKRSPRWTDSCLASPTTVGAAAHGGLDQTADGGIASPISQMGHGDVLNAYSDSPLSPLAGPITRNHWQTDSSTRVCSALACQEPFTLFRRRHHCRKCGGIFCWQHSSHQVRLDELARFHPYGFLHRACDRCYGSFREWEHLRSSRSNSGSCSSSVIAINTPAPAKRPENPRPGSMAHSFQGPWNWSTF